MTLKVLEEYTNIYGQLRGRYEGELPRRWNGPAQGLKRITISVVNRDMPEHGGSNPLPTWVAKVPTISG